MKKAFEFATRSILVLILIAAGSANLTMAQVDAATTSASTPQVKKAPSPKEELSNKLRSSMRNPAEFTANFAEFLNKYPYDWVSGPYINSLGGVFSFEKNPETVRSIINQFLKNTEQLPAALKADIYRGGANILFINKFYEDAARLSQKSLDLLDESDYIEFRRRQFEESNSEATRKERERMLEEAIKQNPAREKEYRESIDDLRRTIPRFNPRGARSDLIGAKMSASNTLGKSFWEQGKYVEAEKAFRDSFAIKESNESTLGIARAAEKNGNDAESLKYATIAALTGKLVPEEMKFFYSVYAKQHQGKTDKAEKYLDAEYKKTFRNPVRGEKYKKTDKRSDRTVLVEFVTGAGCGACIPYEYTFEKVLEDYPAKDVAVIVYHTHIPKIDPLSNNSSDSRVAYYGAYSAPQLFIDGKRFERNSDLSANETDQPDQEDNRFQSIADAVYADLKNNLEIPAEARINLKAKRNGQKVSVRVLADQFKNVSDDVTMHIALVENETTYSGENGLRFHPMVVRALAGDNDKKVFGFKVDPAKANNFDNVFDVDKIIAQNLAYYGAYPVEQTKELAAKYDGTVPEGLIPKFNYKRHQIDPNHLSVIAYLQDNKTKKILQSSQINLANNN